ncbi:MAG: FAD-dependent oxidoreductase [Patescibacteria group bacterium]
MPKKKKIVIVGGGFAGIRLALDLEKHVYKDAEVLLIDDTGFHEYTPSYYKIATLPLSEKEGEMPLAFERMRRMISIPIDDIIDTAKVALVVGRVTRINAEAKELVFESGKKIDFEWLVLAAGSATRFFDIPHLYEYAHVLKSANDAFNIRNAAHELFVRAGKADEVRIIVAGGGSTGSEFIASLAPYVRELARRHGHPSGNISLTLVEAGERIMGSASPWVSRKAEKRLKQLGVKIILSNPIVNVLPAHVELRGGHSFGYDILIWTAGVQASPLAAEIKGANKDEKSCLIVDDRLRVLPYENIFAIGDMAFCSSVGKVGSSMTAQEAIQQGRYLAHTLKRLLHKRATFPYYFRRSKLVVPLGGRYVIADFGWFRFAGILGWCLKCLIALHYLTTILPWSKALKRWRQNV